MTAPYFAARDAHAAAAELEHRLGDPEDSARPLSYARLAELDRDEEFPAAACAELDALGLARYHVPERFGGALTDFEELLHVWRTVARRDLTVAIAYAKTYLGAASVWVGGNADQASRLADDVVAGTVVAWGLTERGHGSDLLAGELTATPTPTGWRLSGEKTMINNATRADVVCVLARTSSTGGPRGFSLLLADKRELPDDSYRCSPKLLTHGIRGADISGISFDDAELPAEAMVGAEGTGVETVLKALQLTRTGCTALSLGAGDHALGLVTRFAAHRRLYGRRLIDVPRARRTLAEATAGLLVAEAVSTTAARHAHTRPEEMSVVSAIAKALVPTIVDDTIDRLGELLGARAFLTDVHAHGMFQKIERDHRIVGIFDGSTAVNESALIGQFPTLARTYADGPPEGTFPAGGPPATGSLPSLDPRRLRLVTGSGCGPVRGLPEAVARAGELSPELGRSAQRVLAACEDVHREMAACPRPAPHALAAAFSLARRYEWCFAAAACLEVALEGRGTFPADREITAAACLDYILARLCPRRGRPPRHDDLLDALSAVPHLGAAS